MREEATMPAGAFYGQEATMPAGAFYGQETNSGWSRNWSKSAAFLSMNTETTVIELARLGYLETLKRFKVRVLVPPAVLLELKTIKVPS